MRCFSRTFLFFLVLFGVFSPSSVFASTAANKTSCCSCLPDGFVYLDTINNKIIPNLMYNTKVNFVGEQIDGYKTNRIILTKQAAEKLNEAWKVFDKDGYNIVVYDSYRPKKAVAHFLRWGSDPKYGENTNKMKSYFFPYLDHLTAFKNEYLSARSGHSRGSTIDMTIIDKKSKLLPIQETKPIEITLSNGQIFYNLNDGTVDMGTSVDLMDEASAGRSTLVSKKAQENREYLKKVMDAAGFDVYSKEWWHFKMRAEPYPYDKDDSYFDFDVREYSHVCSKNEV